MMDNTIERKKEKGKTNIWKTFINTLKSFWIVP